MAKSAEFSDLIETREPELGPQVHLGREEGRDEPSEHGVEFQEAGTVFHDARSITVVDELHSFDELRYFTIGRSAHGRLLSVAHTEDDGKIRIIQRTPCDTRRGQAV